MAANLSKKNRPVFIYLHLTSRCNLRCKYCYANVDGRFSDPKVRDFGTEEWKKLIEDSFTLGARYFHLYGGEPLVREDIGELVDFCKKKGGFVEIMTNGHLIGARIREIENVDSICLSLDGDETTNDAIRGVGTFCAVREAVRVCKKHKIPVRIHAVVNQFNLADPGYLPRLAQEWGVTVSYSQPHVFTYIEDDSIQLTDEQIRTFWKKMRGMKRQGYPIDNTVKALDYVIRWPISYQHVIKTKEEAAKLSKAKGFEFMRCGMGRTAVVIDSQGSLLPCLNFGMFSDANFHKAGFHKAYELLCKRQCFACANLQFVEVNLAMRLSPRSVLKGIAYHL